MTDKNEAKKSFMLLYIIPLKLKQEVCFKVARIFDLILTFFFFGNFNLQEIGFLFILNFILIFIMIILTGSTFKLGIKNKKILKTWKIYRVIFFAINFLIHLGGILELNSNKTKAYEEFELRSELSVNPAEFNSFINRLIIFQVAFLVIDVVHLSWSFSLKNIKK